MIFSLDVVLSNAIGQPVRKDVQVRSLYAFVLTCLPFENMSDWFDHT